MVTAVEENRSHAVAARRQAFRIQNEARFRRLASSRIQAQIRHGAVIAIPVQRKVKPPRALWCRKEHHDMDGLLIVVVVCIGNQRSLDEIVGGRRGTNSARRTSRSASILCSNHGMSLNDVISLRSPFTNRGRHPWKWS